MNAPAKILSDNAYARGLKLSREGRHAEAIACYEEAHKANPNDPQILFVLGDTARILNMPGPAEVFFRRVLALEPGRIEALISLANLLRSKGNPSSAVAVLEPVLEANPKVPELWLTLGSAWRELDARDKAEQHFRQALACRPNYPNALGNLADLLADRGDVDQALALYDHAISRAPQNAQMKLNRAILHFLKGNLKDGWRDYGARLKLEHKTPKRDHGLPRWTGDGLKRKRLLVTAEQGVGDQLMFASMFPDLMTRAEADDARIILECEPRLVPLFVRSFPGAAVHVSNIVRRGAALTAHYDWLKGMGGANAAIEMGSLGRILRREISDFPCKNAYLVPDAGEAAQWRTWLADQGDGPYVGLCWRSGKLIHGRALQYASIEDWAQFIRDLPGTIVCAQYDAGVDEIAVLEAMSGRRIVVPKDIDQKNELDRTCALLSTLDTVISAPTAVSWLAAGAGVPVHKVLYDTSWTSFGQPHEPLAPSCLCVMPDAPGHWDDTFAKAKTQILKQFA